MTIGERKMVKPKQKWTRNEVEALSDGIAKYGQGKWKLILSDPQFARSLDNRSNVDLKDKWRNLTVSGVGSSRRERVRNPVFEFDVNTTLNSVGSGGTQSVTTPLLEGPDLNTIASGDGSARVLGLDLNMTETDVESSSTDRVGTHVLGLDLNLPICCPEPSFVHPVVLYGGTPEPSSVLPHIVYVGTPEPSRSRVDRRADPDYEAMIFEALSSTEDPNGSDVSAILNFIEERYELPQNYRRSVSSKLRRLVVAGELEMVGNFYKYKTYEY